MIWWIGAYVLVAGFLSWVLFGGGAEGIKGTFLSAILIDGLSPVLRRLS